MKQSILGFEVDTISNEDTRDLISLTVRLQSSAFSMKNHNMCITDDLTDEAKLVLTREVNKHYENYLKILEEVQIKIAQINLELIQA